MSEATPKGILKVAITDFNGDAIAGGGSAVSLADGADVTEGTKADTAWDGVAASASVVAILKKIATSGASAGLTDTQLRASAVPVSGTFWQATQPVTDPSQLAGGAAITIATQPVSMVGVRTAAATATALQGMSDNADAIAASGVGNSLRVGALGYQFNGTTWDRLRGDATNGLKVQGTFWQTTQPVSIAASVAVTGPLTDTQLRASAVPVSSTQLPAALGVNGGMKIDGSGVSLPVSGVMDVNDRAARLLGIVDKGKLWDGTNIAAVKAASVAPVATDPALVVTISPNSPAASGLTDTQLRASAVPVSGAFFQATQPVSLAASVAVTGPLTDTQIRATALPVSGTFWQATQPVSVAGSVAVTGTFFQATQPVSIAASVAVTGPLTDTQLRASAVPVSLGTVKAASTLAAATDTSLVVTQTPMRADASTLLVTGTAASGVGLTLTLPAAAAGLFHYITSIRITKYGGAAAAGAATPVLVTTTNIPGALVWTTKTLLGIGDTEQIYETFPTPLKSSVAATATTIVAPIVAGTLWRMTVTYYTAP